jgi:hypothetical protein
VELELRQKFLFSLIKVNVTSLDGGWEAANR